jgi:hypothetical protein
MKPAPLVFEEQERIKNSQENTSTSKRRQQTDIVWDAAEPAPFCLVSFGSADPTKTISAKDCSIALTNFYTKLSVLPDHWIPGYWTVFQIIQHLGIRGLQYSFHL